MTIVVGSPERPVELNIVGSLERPAELVVVVGSPGNNWKATGRL